MEVVNLEEKFGLFEDHWNPRIVGQLNGQEVKIAKVKGEFVWHNHKNEDEMFLIIKGQLKIDFEDGMRTLNQGEMLIVPKGVEHKPIAEEETWIMLFEPQSTAHTGEVRSHLTVDEPEKI